MTKKRGDIHDITCAAYIAPRNVAPDGRKRGKAARNDSDSIFAYGLCFCDNLAYHSGTGFNELFIDLSRRAPLAVYVHDLNTVGKFIIAYLFETGFTWTEKIKISPMQFTTLISGDGVIYLIKLCFKYGKTGRKRVVQFRNINQKIQGTMTEMASACGITYDRRTLKTDIDEPDAEDMEIIRNRAEILAKSFQPILQLQWYKLTAGADIIDKYKQYIGRSLYREFFPVLKPAEDKFARAAYFGGLIYCNDEIRGKNNDFPVYVYDINSAYVFAMCDFPMPYGHGVYFRGKPNPPKNTPLYICRITVSCRTKYGRRPVLMQNEPFAKNIVYIDDTQGVEIPITLTSVDLAMLFENYEIESIHYYDGYYYHASNNLFNAFLRPYYENKKNARGALRQTYKKPLVAFYGKFGKQTDYTQLLPEFVDGDLKMQKVIKVTTDPEYCPVAVFTSAYVRRILITAINQNNTNFLYADTDSMHLRRPAYGININPDALGAWKLEHTFTRSKYLGQKMYYGIESDGGEVVKISGAQAEVKMRIHYDNFNPGETFDGAYHKYYVKHGLVVVNRTFTLPK